MIITVPMDPTEEEDILLDEAKTKYVEQDHSEEASTMLALVELSLELAEVSITVDKAENDTFYRPSKGF